MNKFSLFSFQFEGNCKSVQGVPVKISNYNFILYSINIYYEQKNVMKFSMVEQERLPWLPILTAR